jgi:hypothetical protein
MLVGHVVQHHQFQRMVGPSLVQELWADLMALSASQGDPVLLACLIDNTTGGLAFLVMRIPNTYVFVRWGEKASLFWEVALIGCSAGPRTRAASNAYNGCGRSLRRAMPQCT